MNKKVLMLTITLLAVAMLATPMVGMVQAGKGQEKLDFKLHLEGGFVMFDWDKAWYAGETLHIRGWNWEVALAGDFYIEIGVGGIVEIIPKEELSYDASMDYNRNVKQGFYVVTIREIITIYTDDTKTTPRGTLEIFNTGDNPAGKGHIFVGHGTDEFEGVKVSGKSTRVPGPPATIDRVGTVMGWPTP